MKAIQVRSCGGPDQLEYLEVPIPSPLPRHALVRVEAIGVNYIDVYFRTGFYKADLPISIGMEAAGVVEEVGSEVDEVNVGDRVAYAMCTGSYAEYAVVPSRLLVKLPQAVDFQQGAAVMLQGMTAHYLTRSTFPLKQGQTALVHAAAGGVGLLAVQMGKICGARIIGTVSTEAKAELARQAGADEVILYTEQDFSTEVRRMTEGRGVDVVYDSVGAATFMKSLDCLRPRGMLVAFGRSSGPAAPFEPLVLNRKGSLFVTDPGLQDYVATREELLSRANDLFDWLSSGRLKLHIGGTYKLSQAPQAHRDLEARKTFGKLILTP